MDRKFFTTLFFSLFFVCLSYGQTEFKSGLILAVGKGTLVNQKSTSEIGDKIIANGGKFSTSYNNIAIGYKFRLQPKTKPFFYDIDIYAGRNKINLKYPYYEYTDNEGVYHAYCGHSGKTYYYFSINPSWNYTIYKKLYAGAGIEPTLYYVDGADSGEKWKFDLPLTLKVGYNLKYVDFAFSYKFGTLRQMKNGPFISGRLNNWQIQLFIPF